MMQNESTTPETSAGVSGRVDQIVMHGYNCEKKPHTFKNGYLHAEDDDSAYNVDGVTYCGRCHAFLDLQGV